MEKNLKNLCYLDGKEHVFLYNLTPYKRKWWCDVIETEDSVIESNVKTVPFEGIKFANDPNDERKNYLIQCESSRSDEFYKKMAEQIKARIKKIQEIEATRKN